MYVRGIYATTQTILVNSRVESELFYVEDVI